MYPDPHHVPAGCFRSFAFGPTVASMPLVPAGAIRLGGWSVIETTGAAPATVELWDGSATGGATVALITLAAGAALTNPLPGHGVLITSNLFLNVIAGSVRGAIWVAPSGYEYPDTLPAGARL